MGTVSVRYFADDVDTAIGFYRDLLGFEVVMHPAPPVDRLRGAGVSFRNEIVEGVGGRQILVDDPAGNCVELFEPGQR